MVLDNLPIVRGSDFRCCGKLMEFRPRIIYCYGKLSCRIKKNDFYHNFEDRYTFCSPCFERRKDPVTFETGELDTPTVSLGKSDFIKVVNSEINNEPTINCITCRDLFHPICVMHIDKITPSGYECDECLRKKKQKRAKHLYDAKTLPHTNMGGYIEKEVNSFLQRNNVKTAKVIIRVLSASDKFCEVKPLMKDLSNEPYPEKFPFRSKAIFAFQEFEGVDVLFFGMHVQEYGSDCPEPNNRRVYVSYLDSVNFFAPRDYRTKVYHEIVLSYFRYVKGRGFRWAHIWSCPPALQGDDYIFYCHPLDQKFPKQQRLLDWYTKLLDYGLLKSQGPIDGYSDLKIWCDEVNYKNIYQLPYFEGDLWPGSIEESLAEIRKHSCLKLEIPTSQKRKTLTSNSPMPPMPNLTPVSNFHARLADVDDSALEPVSNGLGEIKVRTPVHDAGEDMDQNYSIEESSQLDDSALGDSVIGVEDSQNNKNKKNACNKKTNSKKAPSNKRTKTNTAKLLAANSPAPGLPELKVIRTRSDIKVALKTSLDKKIEANHDTFFQIRLYNEESPEKNQYYDTFDPDFALACPLFDGRIPFLQECRINYHEFSTVRHAKYSTTVILYKLHTQMQESTKKFLEEYFIDKDQNDHDNCDQAIYMDRRKLAKIDDETRVNKVLSDIHLSRNGDLKNGFRSPSILSTYAELMKKQALYYLCYHSLCCKGCNSDYCKYFAKSTNYSREQILQLCIN